MTKDPKEQDPPEKKPPRQDPLHQFFDEAADLLAMIQKKKMEITSGELPEGIKERLIQVQLAIQLFCKMHESIMKDAELPSEQIPVSNKDHRLLDYAQKLKKEADDLKKEFSTKTVIAKQREKTQGKGAKKERKKKFDQLGGRKDWKPL